MAAAKLGLKSPSVPLFQWGNLLRRALTPLWKRGEGEIFERNELRIMWQISGTAH